MRQWLVDALDTASAEARRRGSPGGYRSKVVADLLREGGPIGLATDAAVQVAGAGSKALGAVGDAVTAPGGAVMSKINDVTQPFPSSAGGSALKYLGLSTPALAIGGVLAMPLLAQRDRGTSLHASNVPVESGHTLDLLDNVYAKGITPMTDPFKSFVQQRKAASEQEKTAAKLPSQLGNLGMSGLGDLLNDFLFTTTTNNAGKAVRSVKALPALGLGAAGAGILAADDFLDSDPTAPLAYQAKKTMFGLGDRIEAEDTFASNFVAQSGKNTANLLKDLVDHTMTGGVDAIKGIPEGVANRAQASDLINNDEVLQRATDSQKDMLHRSFNTMQKYAPELASDEFVVRNYLRESLMSSNGPDYGTVANLAKANQTVSNPFKTSK